MSAMLALADVSQFRRVLRVRLEEATVHQQCMVGTLRCRRRVLLHSAHGMVVSRASKRSRRQGIERLCMSHSELDELL